MKNERIGRVGKPLTDLQYLRMFCGEVEKYKDGNRVRMMTIKTNENVMGPRFTKIVSKMGYELYTAVVRNDKGLFMAFYHKDDVDMVDQCRPMHLIRKKVEKT